MITLKTLHLATEKEVFQQAKEHLLRQGEKGEDPIFGCAYKTKEGLKCGAGCFISEDEYKSEFESLTWNELIIRGFVSIFHADLIKEIQIIHDNYDVEYWEHEFNKLESKLK